MEFFSIYNTSSLFSNGRIPPLPRGYSQSLNTAIKSMLNLNVRTRFRARALCYIYFLFIARYATVRRSDSSTRATRTCRQDARYTQVVGLASFNIFVSLNRISVRLANLKGHRNNLAGREREIAAREAILVEKEQKILSIISQKDNEINTLKLLVSQFEQKNPMTPQEVDSAIKAAVSRREEELRLAILQREEEALASTAAREEEILTAVRKREAEVFEALVKREAEISRNVQTFLKEFEERERVLQEQEVELREEEERLEAVRAELEAKAKELEENLKRRSYGAANSPSQLRSSSPF